MPLLFRLCFLIGLVLTSFAAEPTGNGQRGSTTWSPFVETNFPFFSSVLDARRLGPGWPADNLTPRGLILNLGHGAWACFDVDLLRMSAIWQGRGVSPVSMSQISYHSPGAKVQEGQERLPQIQGTPWLANGIYPGWQAGDQISLSDPREPGPDPKEVGRGPISPSAGRFKAARLIEGSVRLEYEVAGILVQEWVEARSVEGQPIVQRRFRIERVTQPLWLILGRSPMSADAQLSVLVAAEQLNGKPVAERADQPDGLLAVHVHPSRKPVQFQVAMGMIREVKTWTPSRSARADTPPLLRWPEKLTTVGKLSSATNAYVVDNISLPVDNPWQRNIRLADIAFSRGGLFRDSRAAAVTFDGDVWMISGLEGDLSHVTWKRFTSGLHEPLSMCFRDRDLFVFDRNGIWRLRDTDGNGEADAHELFSNAFTQTAETREFASGMRVAPDGSFVIGKGGLQFTTLGKHNGSVLRIAPDGKSSTVLGWGFRDPHIGVNLKTGLVTASDQQGNYIPSTPLHVVRDNQYYGFLSKLLPREQYPAPIAEPLTWIPHPINPSAVSQAWLVGARMGPLNEAMIHIGYYRPELFRVLLNERTSRLQGAVVSVTRDFEFAPLNGAVNPRDGQFYVIGFQIWGTEAKQLSGLARVRYTGAPCTLPKEIVPMDKGVLLRFDVALDAEKAANAANYSAERWNYARTFNYGSPHFKLDGTKGSEAIAPSSAYVSKDRKNVFIGVPDMKRVMQMRLGYALATRSGAAFQGNIYFTPYELVTFNPTAEGFEPLNVDLTPRAVLAAAQTPVTAEEGRRIAELMGCVACHSNDGTTVGKVGPSWKGLFGSERVLANGGRVIADEAYLTESIKEPSVKVARGFDRSDTGMPSYEGVITDAQIQAVIRYIEALK